MDINGESANVAEKELKLSALTRDLLKHQSQHYEFAPVNEVQQLIERSLQVDVSDERILRLSIECEGVRCAG